MLALRKTLFLSPKKSYSKLTLLYVLMHYFQGEVEQIAMMKPKSANGHETGMLEYLEDIVGTSRFKVCASTFNIYD